MIPELGNFALILALVLTLSLAIVPTIGFYTKQQSLINYAWPLTYGYFIFTALSFVLLAYSFIQDDFSVAFIANHSNSLLPMQYKFSAVWGGHEGSLLLWMMILSTWTVAVSLFSKNIERQFIARVLITLGLVSTGFLAFILYTSNPFDRILPNIPMDGRDLNPMLQDVGLVMHPPMLYMGYVGFSVAFAFAIAALVSGKMDSTWARWSRPWTLAAWGFLSVGIALGSWWAYYELGWGGWWFWDPVENASFMPWIIGTALVHSLAVTEKRQAFVGWTLLLSIIAFSLSLLGTFLVRSGVLTSVHSFAADPSRGLFILLLLAITIGASLTLFAAKVGQLKTQVKFSLLSKEFSLLIANVVLVIAASTVLLGTLYPLLIDALNLGKISVGPPYFNAVFIPIMSVLFIVMGYGPFLKWYQSQPGDFKSLVKWPLILSLLVGFGYPMYLSHYSFSAAFGVLLASWVGIATLQHLFSRLRKQSISQILTKNRSFLGMIFAHLGVAITITGITLVSIYEEQTDVRMDLDSQVSLAGYTFIFKGVNKVQGDNYTADQAQIRVYHDQTPVAILSPERRHYTVQTMGMTEAGIDPGLFRDLYVSLGDSLSNDAWAVRVHYKPFIRWVWLGAIFMGLGAAFSISDRRYRAKKQADEKQNSSVLVTAETTS